MRTTALLALALGACNGISSAPAESPEEKAAMKEFEDWRQVVVRMELEKIWEGMSLGMKSDWLYNRLRDAGDGDMIRMRKDLKGTPDQDLEIWLLDNGRARPDRPSILPESILVNPWLYRTFVAYYEPLKKRLALEFQNLEVVKVAADQTGATVACRNKVLGGTDRYLMVWEGKWKVDMHMEPGMIRPK